ncbi:ATP-binding protein [Phenylobacterium sp.]|uniref:ATP-binding protein n=1 Tax=Phenylobacterium sp. TaxID=1871053 RepID=UPI002ED9154C
MRLRIVADKQGVIRAAKAARAFAARCELAERHADRLALVLEEWLGNVVEHGGAAPGSRIVIRLDRPDARVRLTMSDAGAAFDPRAAAFQGPNLQRGGGVGLELVRAWAEILDYRRRRARNRVVLAVGAP